MEDFVQRFDACLDYQRYLASKGIYAEQGDRCIWEPLDWTDVEPTEPAHSLGAAVRGEFDDNQDWFGDRGEF